jgi:large subunit ribosomal protein L4
MTKIALYNLKGEKEAEIELPEAVFAVPGNDTLLHQVYVAISNNLRQTVAHTKDRSDRAGSGRKPWRQKGTGRARIGEVRAPHWRKGGVVFGPTNERNYSKQTNRKMRRKALRIALSEKVRAGKLFVVDSMDFPEKKTKEFIVLSDRLGLSGKRTLVALRAEERESSRASRNVPKVENVFSEDMSAYDLLNHEYLILSKASVDMLSKRFENVSGTE